MTSAGVPGHRPAPAVAAGLPDRVERVVEMRSRLDVHGDVVGARLRELRHLPLGALDHQVHVDDRPGAVHLIGQRADHQGAERDRRDEVPVHHVDVDDARAGRQHLGDLRAQAGEIRRQDRGRDAPFAQGLGVGQPSDRLQHAALAVVAGDDRCARHPHDRRVLAAVGADRHELVALQAVDAAVSTRHGGGAQPRLAATGALGTELDRGFGAHGP